LLREQSAAASEIYDPFRPAANLPHKRARLASEGEALDRVDELACVRLEILTLTVRIQRRYVGKRRLGDTDATTSATDNTDITNHAAAIWESLGLTEQAAAIIS